MASIRRHLIFLVIFALAAGCSSANQTTSAGTLQVTATPSTALADGVNTFVIHVEGNAKAPISLVAARGTFDNGTNTATFDAVPFDAVLHTCNAASDASCAGLVLVQVAGSDLASGSTRVTFLATGSGGTDAGTGGTDGGTGGTDGGTGGTGGTGKLGQIQLVSEQFQVLGARGSGFQEVSALTFQVLDTAGVPFPAGLTVSFTHASLGGSYIGDVATCTKAVPSICSASGVTDASGQVVVMLTSGQTAGNVAVTASATAGGLTATGAASDLAVIGAKASGAHLTLDCSPKNVPALVDDDCSFSHYAGKDALVTCTATFADRFNNVLGVAQQATFLSEAGSAGPPDNTLAYDSTKPAAGQVGLGIATGFVNVTGGKLPVDVAPFAGEFSFQYQDVCGNLVHNPRDGLSTIIVMASGEEGFVDVNGNGVYDGPGSPALSDPKYAAFQAKGEPFVDMGEPYVDANDNGQWDPGEPFVDVNGNGVYDGPNGVWDAKTAIWAETRILYTGFPAVGQTAGGLDEFSRFFATGSLPAPTTPPTFAVKGSATGPTQQLVDVVFMDGNFNDLASTFSYDTKPLETGLVTSGYLFSPGTVDHLGMTASQLYCDKPAAQGPTVCANVCPTAPCYVVTNIGNCVLPGRTGCTGFGYGNTGVLQVAGTCSKGTSPVPATVMASATLNQVSTTIFLTGTCTP